MDIKEIMNIIKKNELLSALIIELLRDNDAYNELSKYFVVSNDGLFLRPIGIVRHGLSDDVVRASSTGVDGVIEVFEEFVDGLRNIDGFSHIILISLFNKVTRDQRNVLVVKPRRLVKFGVSSMNYPKLAYSRQTHHIGQTPPSALVLLGSLVGMEGSSGFLGLTYLMVHRYWTLSHTLPIGPLALAN